MDLTPHLDAIRGDLDALAGTDDTLREALERVDRPLEASLQVRLLDAIGDAAAELSPHVPDGHVEVRLAGRDVQLVFTGEPAAQPEPPSAADEEGGMARLTLRMPESLKASVEEAADREGLSVNGWLIRGIKDKLRGTRESSRKSAHRFTGHVRG